MTYGVDVPVVLFFLQKGCADPQIEKEKKAEVNFRDTEGCLPTCFFLANDCRLTLAPLLRFPVTINSFVELFSGISVFRHHRGKCVRIGEKKMR